MSGRARSVTDRATFASLRSSRRRGRSGPLGVAYVPGGSSDAPRVAYAVGRWVGNAVARNRVRRRLRAAVETMAGNLPAGAYLITAGADACDLPFDQLRAQLWKAIQTATGTNPG
ncbi:MAG: ribonuclease P protein component [Actinomycetota bacterium]|nr:ribonuclease P protein component [Actinomycetota bacterium]